MSGMVSVYFFTVPTVRFQVLYVFLVLAHERRQIVHVAVTAPPTAEWTAQQQTATASLVMTSWSNRSLWHPAGTIDSALAIATGIR
jgi:hypothetical protein